MKQSYYNFFVKEDDRLYCFNGLTKNFFSIKSENEATLLSILDSSETIKEKLPHFYNLLSDGGFIINDNTDELELIRANNREACNSKKYNLVILPTLDCNFRCWYCYENHTPYSMSNSTIEKIKKYVTRLVEREEMESLQIEWFGGEPFLHFEDVIQPISLHAKEQCKAKNIPFATGATSNGYLINQKVARELAELNFSFIQVTLDGEKSKHDQTRVAPNNSSFETILQNMNYLSRINPQTNITIRINYDEKNFYPKALFSQVKELIDEDLHSHFTFLLRKVWQVGHVENGNEKLKEFIQLILNSKFNYHSNADFNMDFKPCYAAHKNMKLITPYGSIGKCTTKNDFEKTAIGHLTEDGSIELNHQLPFDEIYATPLFENEKCLECKQLPLCMGNCPKNIDPEGNITLTKECRGKVNDLKLADSILLFCKINEEKNELI